MRELSQDLSRFLSLLSRELLKLSEWNLYGNLRLEDMIHQAKMVDCPFNLSEVNVLT